MNFALGTISLMLAGLLLAATYDSVRHTTLLGSWRWAALALLAWIGVGVAGLTGVAPETLDRLWYGTAVLTLAPLVHVLGARRPVARSWNGFVILPMLAVLGLPLVTTWGSATDGPFEIELPPLLGFLLVLTMGAGNYFGTRFTLPATWLAAGLTVAVLAGSTLRPAWFPDPATARMLGVALFGIAVLSAGRHGLARTPPDEPVTSPQLDVLWRDFRDLFGIVWAKRVMDRVNESLAAAHLETRLDLDGIARPDGERDAADRIIHDTFAWLLRRFVDPPWAGRYGVTLRDGGDPRTNNGQ